MTEIETQLRDRLHRLADAAPTAVVLPDEIRLRSTASAPSPERRLRKWLGIGTAGLVLAGGGGITLLASNQAGTEPGAASPIEAVTMLAKAIGNEDVLGALDILAPEEVSAIRFSLEQVTSDAKRIGIVSDGFKLDALAGVDVEVKDLKFSAETVGDGITVVRATAGTVAGSFDPAAFPLGADLSDLIGDGGLQPTSATATMESGNGFVTTVERDGRWFVSPVYTAMEYARRGSDRPLPPAPTTIPEGFDTPGLAANEFYRRLATLDMASVLPLMAPGEGEVFARYLPLWIADAQASLDESRSKGLSFDVGNVEVQVEGPTDRKFVTPIKYSLDATMPADALDFSGPDETFNPEWPTFVIADNGRMFVIEAGQPIPDNVDRLDPDATVDGSNFNYLYAEPDGTIPRPAVPADAQDSTELGYHLEFADGCSVATGTYIDRAHQAYAEASGSQCVASQGLLGGSLLGVLGLGSVVVNLPSVTTVRVDGKWYIAPIGTALGLYTDALRLAGDDALSSFDSPLASWTFGTQRSWMEVRFVDQAFADQSPACQVVLVADADGVITGIIEDPDRAAIRACNEEGSVSSSYEYGADATEATAYVAQPLTSEVGPPPTDPAVAQSSAGEPAASASAP